MGQAPPHIQAWRPPGEVSGGCGGPGPHLGVALTTGLPGLLLAEPAGVGQWGWPVLSGAEAALNQAGSALASDHPSHAGG